MSELSVQIGANITDLIKKLKLTEKELKELEKLSKKTGKGFGRAFDDFATSAGKAGKEIKGNAVPAITEFSRVIQDAPYGIQGVANNITQLTQQFGYLSKSSGGAKKALKSMVGTLTGPAGILLAVSAVTSLLVSYGDEIMGVIKGNDALANSQKAVTKAMNEFYGTQATQIYTYIDLLEDANTSEKERKNIIDELIKTVPNLTKEDFKYGNNLDVVKGKINEYIGAQASRIQADKLVEENAEALAKQARIRNIKSIKNESERLEAIKAFLKEEGVLFFKGRKMSFAKRVNQRVAKDAQDFINDIEKISNEIESDLKPVNQKIQELLSNTFSHRWFK